MADRKVVSRREMLGLGAAAAGAVLLAACAPRTNPSTAPVGGVDLGPISPSTTLASGPTTPTAARPPGQRWSQGRFSGDVTLPPGDWLLDVDADVTSLIIPSGASLTFDPAASRTLQSSGNVVVEGKLRMVAPTFAVNHLLKFVNVNESAFVGGGMAPLPTDVGLWIIDGLWEACGTPKIGWVNAAGALSAGTTSIKVDRDPDGWQPGDELAVAPTLRGNNGSWDYVTITAVDGRQISFSTPLRYAHPTCDVGGGKIMSAEVLNLTRNVRVEGTPGGKSHVFVHSMMPQGDMDDGLCHVQFRYMGPRKNRRPSSDSAAYMSGHDVLGRYALHFHHCMDGSRGTKVNACVVRDSDAHAFVPHHSHGIHFYDCVSHNTVEAAYWWDPPPEDEAPFSEWSEATVYERCVASKLRMSDATRYDMLAFNLGIVDPRPMDGVISKLDSKCIGCVAVDSRANDDSTGAFTWEAHQEGVWVFQDCVAHNCATSGIRIWHNSSTGHLLEGFTSYRNGGHGVSWGAYSNPYQFRDAHMAENDGLAFTVAITASQAAQGDPRILGQTARIVDSYLDASGQEFAVDFGDDSPVAGVAPFLMQNCTLTGYTKAAADIGAQGNRDEAPNSVRFEGCTFTGTGPVVLKEPGVRPDFVYTVS